MNQLLVSKFDRMGARAKIRDVGVGRRHLSIDIRQDAHGEYFQIRQPTDLRLDAVDVRPQDRHLLLIARERGSGRDELPTKYLCGHDERHWFVAAVPEK